MHPFQRRGRAWMLDLTRGAGASHVQRGFSAPARVKVASDGDEHLEHLPLVGDEPGDDFAGTLRPGLQIDGQMVHLLLQLQQSGQVGLHEDEALKRFSQALAHARTLVDLAVNGVVQCVNVGTRRP